MNCKWCRELYTKYCCPCLQNNLPPNPPSNTKLPKDIADTLSDTNIFTAPTPIDNDPIINDPITNDTIINDSIANDTNINNNPNHTYGTEPAQSRKTGFTIDNDYIRKSADSIEIYSPRANVSDDIHASNKTAV
tara:strand:+ start:704 stop:1105 length:402 start_codon:yes stop_codon:yes gene_type:complete